jgi:hypothetical protein
MIYWCNFTLNTDNIKGSVNVDIEGGVPRGDVAFPEDPGTPHTEHY